MRKIITLLFFTSILGGNFIFQHYEKNIIINYLNTSLPFREAYSPSVASIVYIYLIPIVLGIVIGGIFNRSRRSLYYINLSLFIGLINFIPFLLFQSTTDINWFLNLAIIYYFILFPILFLVGCLPYFVIELSATEVESSPKPMTFLDIIVAFLFGSLMFVLNLIPQTLTKYFVGADIYYHAALTEKINDNFNIFQNPFFLEGKNYYYSIGYFLLAYIHKFFHIDISLVWMVIVPIFSFIFIFFFYLLSRGLTKSFFLATIATLLIFPFGQILWYDPSLRVLSYGFLLCALYFFYQFNLHKKALLLVISLFFFLLAALTHPEIAIHSVWILGAYFLMRIIPQITLFLQKFFLFIFYIKITSFYTFYLKGMEMQEIFIALLCVYLMILLTKYLFVLQNFSINRIMTFNEIPLSLLQPFGAISFITFMFLPIGLYRIILNKSETNTFFLSIASLFSFIVFYFLHVWSLYHRYFTETAYIALAIVSTQAIGTVFTAAGKKMKLLFFLIITVFFTLSLIPKYLFISSYALSTNTTVESYQPVLNLISRNTKPNTVVMLSAESMLNRYIPTYTNRYIFAGSDTIDKNHQWQVLSFCNGPFMPMCDKRLKLSDDFFLNPSKEKLHEIKSIYAVDYILLENDQIMSDKFKKSNIQFEKYLLAKNTGYALYDVRRVKE